MVNTLLAQKVNFDGVLGNHPQHIRQYWSSSGPAGFCSVNAAEMLALRTELLKTKHLNFQDIWWKVTFKQSSLVFGRHGSRVAGAFFHVKHRTNSKLQQDEFHVVVVIVVVVVVIIIIIIIIWSKQGVHRHSLVIANEDLSFWHCFLLTFQPCQRCFSIFLLFCSF